MAKSRNWEVDKLERKARLGNVERQRQVERRELQNLNRIGWQEFDEDDECLEEPSDQE